MSNTKRTITSLLGGIIAAALLLSPLQSVDAAVATASVSAVSDQVSVKGLTAAEQKRADEINKEIDKLAAKLDDIEDEHDEISRKLNNAKKKENKAKKKGYKIHGVVETLTIRGKDYTVLTVENDSAERDGYSYVISKKYNNSKYLIQSHKVAWARHSHHYNIWVKSGDMDYVYANDDYSRVVLGHAQCIRVNYGSAKYKKQLKKKQKEYDKVVDKIVKLRDELEKLTGDRYYY